MNRSRSMRPPAPRSVEQLLPTFEQLRPTFQHQAIQSVSTVRYSWAYIVWSVFLVDLYCECRTVSVLSIPAGQFESCPRYLGGLLCTTAGFSITRTQSPSGVMVDYATRAQVTQTHPNFANHFRLLAFTRANHVKPQRNCKSKPHTVALQMWTAAPQALSLIHI